MTSEQQIPTDFSINNESTTPADKVQAAFKYTTIKKKSKDLIKQKSVLKFTCVTLKIKSGALERLWFILYWIFYLSLFVFS